MTQPPDPAERREPSRAPDGRPPRRGRGGPRDDTARRAPDGAGPESGSGRTRGASRNDREIPGGAQHGRGNGRNGNQRGGDDPQRDPSNPRHENRHGGGGQSGGQHGPGNDQSGGQHGGGDQSGGRHGGGGQRGGQRGRGNRSRGPRRHHTEQRPAFTPEQITARRAAVPPISYPEQLPVSARRDEIAAAIRDHQVVVVAGETGSGKTTQIPKICLELGRGVEGMIGHTQPRRIAARTVAERLCDEMGVDLGNQVGYQVRFTDQVGPTTLVKLMTDGILLAEIQRDPLLRRYDTIIIDEAHERSLNIDFLLGYLATLLPLRPDLKLVITSATIDSARFAAHFGRRDRSRRSGEPHDLGALIEPAPVVEVTGRTYPVEIRYRPLVPDTATDEVGAPLEDFDAAGNLHLEDSSRAEAVDQVTGILEACDELMAEGPGDILVFLSGEAEIRDTHVALADQLGERYVPPGRSRGNDASPAARLPGAVEVVPLYARLTSAEQHRVFEPHTTRRIVLATNVAETSLTVPGIRYVVDPGTARISRFSNKTKVQRLPIEPVSQASANQRAGRCGRVADGIAIRLYSRRDYQARPEYTEPEILRTSLASVILQMAALGLGDVSRFPFVDPPEGRSVRDGVQLLVEIGALEDPKRTRVRDEPAPDGSEGHAAGRDAVTRDARAGRDAVARDARAGRDEARTGAPQAGQHESRTGTGPDAVAGVPGRDTEPAPRGPFRSPGPRLTKIGRELARLPIDPRLGRMLLEAQKNGCAAEVLVIVAALSCQDVRERPVEKQQLADQFHRRFTDPTSDFLAYLNLWRYLRVQQRDLSGSAFRRLCRSEFLNYLRVREWQDVVGQLRQLAKPLGLSMRPIALPSSGEIDAAGRAGDAGATPAGGPGGASDTVAAAVKEVGSSRDTPSADALHKSLLVGLLSNLGNYDERKRDYAGARGTRFVVWPGSGLARRTPAWVMAAELVETSRLFARTVAKIEPEWVEPAAEHLLTRVYGDPYWSTKHGAAMVTEKVMLYGMTLVADRVVPLTRIGTAEARETARELFLSNALVDGDWRAHHGFVKANEQMVARAEEVAARARQYGLLADEDARAAFFAARVPESVTSARHFDSWWKRERRANPDLLTYTLDVLLPHGSGADEGDYPDTWTQGDLTLPLRYEFAPGRHADGVTCVVPVTVLGRLRPDGFDWMVPGMAAELAVATIKGLPKRVRRELVPAPDVAAQIVPLLPAWSDVAGSPDRRPDAPSYREAFTAAARQVRGVDIDAEAWADATLPEHLRMNFRVTSERGAVLSEGSDLPALQRELAPQTADAVRSAVRGAVALAMDEATARLGRGGHGGRGGRGGRGSAAGSDGGAAGAAQRDGGRGAGAGGRGAGAGGRGAGAGGRGGARAGIDGGAPAAGGAAPALTEQPGLTDWPDVPGGRIPVDLETVGPQGLVIRGYPALIEERGPKEPGKPARVTAALRVLADPTSQVTAHRLGVRRLVLDQVRLSAQRITTRWSGEQALALASSPYANTDALVADLQLAAVTSLTDAWCAAHVDGGPGAVRTREQFADLVAHVRAGHEEEVHRLAAAVTETLRAQLDLQRVIREATSMALIGVLTDVKDQAARLVFQGFLAATPAAQLVHLPRYLRAAQRRIERARANVHADEAAAWKVHEVEDDYLDAEDRYRRDLGLPEGTPGRAGAGPWGDPAAAVAPAVARLPHDASLAGRRRTLDDVRWLVEELRVSLFAQQLGTPVKVSEQRIRKLLTGG